MLAGMAATSAAARKNAGPRSTPGSTRTCRTCGLTESCLAWLQNSNVQNWKTFTDPRGSCRSSSRTRPCCSSRRPGSRSTHHWSNSAAAAAPLGAPPRGRLMASSFDADERLRRRLRHFYAEVLGDERSDDDTDAALGLGRLEPGDACPRRAVRARSHGGRGMAQRGLRHRRRPVARFLELAREDAARAAWTWRSSRATCAGCPSTARSTRRLLVHLVRVLRRCRRTSRCCASSTACSASAATLVVETLSHDGYVRSLHRVPRGDRRRRRRRPHGRPQRVRRGRPAGRVPPGHGARRRAARGALHDPPAHDPRVAPCPRRRGVRRR